MTSVKILGTGHYAPPYIVRNDDFTKFLDTSDEWISTRTGMCERHFALDESPWLMGAKAARVALDSAGLEPDDVDLVIGTTVTSDYYIPSMASIVQYELGIKDAYAFDISVACTGLSFAIDIARRYLCTGDYRRALIVCAESPTQFIDFSDRSMCVLFGDGAGACIVEKAEGIYGSYQRNDISGSVSVYGRRSRRTTPFDHLTGDGVTPPFEVGDAGYFRMAGRGVYKISTVSVPTAIEEACKKAGITVSELDLIFPHQANLRILETIAKNMSIPMEKIAVNIEKYGNTSSASIPICLDEYIRGEKIKRGDKICLVGFGAGFNYSATVLEY